MRPTFFRCDVLRQYLLQAKMATLEELKRALGTQVDLTVFRKLKQLDSLTSYSHRARYYTLRPNARFDADGLWSHEGVWFSRHGTLLATAATWVQHAPQGYFAEELAEGLHVEVHDALYHLVAQRKIARQRVSGLYLYSSSDPIIRRRQLLARRRVQTVPTLLHASQLEISPGELRAAILLFYSLLDEQQRRLYAGLESLKLGHGGDRQLAEFLNLDTHTVARGRQQLSDQDVAFARVRKMGGGRRRAGKKTPK
jgi:hypothetical protein